MARVAIFLYGQPKTFRSKKAAKEFCIDGIINTEGSERDRFVEVLEQLEAGKTLCYDCFGVR